jgi:hypothetical protein
MLVIRDEQMRVLRQRRDLPLVPLRVADLLLEDNPRVVEGLSDAEVDTLARTAADRALRYGIVEAEHVTEFAVLMRLLAPRFDEHPAAQAVLTSPAFRPDDLRGQLMANLGPVDLLHIGAEAGAGRAERG